MLSQADAPPAIYASASKRWREIGEIRSYKVVLWICSDVSC